MVRIDITYEGALRCRARHMPSGVQLATDAPVDNCGRGESFSPTDLVATALGTCLLTILGILARRDGVELGGAAVVVEKTMSTGQPRRIAALALVVDLPAALPPAVRSRYEAAARDCPVWHSLDPAIAVTVAFRYG
jgi:putative redox protein